MVVTRGRDTAPADAARSDEGFLTRWSRRKREARAASDAQATPSPATAADVAGSVAPPAAPVAVPVPASAPPPGDEDMPPLESLGAGSDVSAFFSPRVSEALRRAALRRIFRQPEFNASDGLDPYLTDFRNLKPLGDVVTADMRLGVERARERLAKLAEPPPPEAGAAAGASDPPSPDATEPAGEDHDDA